MNSDYSSKEIRLPHRRISFHLSVSFLSWPVVLVGKSRGTCFEWNLQYWQPLRLRSKWKTSGALGRWMFGVASTPHHAISRQYCDASDFPWLPVSPLNLTERVVTADADLVKGRFVWQDFVLARDCVHHVHDLRLSHSQQAFVRRPKMMVHHPNDRSSHITCLKSKVWTDIMYKHKRVNKCTELKKLIANYTYRHNIRRFLIMHGLDVRPSVRPQNVLFRFERHFVSS